MTTSSAEPFILTITCPDRRRIVADVASFLAAQGAFINDSCHFGDPDTNRFFMRTVFKIEDTDTECTVRLTDLFAPIAREFDMSVLFKSAWTKPKVLFGVSKTGHCLNHLLHQWHVEELPIDIVGVVSNHEDLRRLVEWYGIAFHYFPISAGDKSQQERQILQLIKSTKADLLVLARYMQILSNEMSAALVGRCINIHHSFLPSFKGARPYHQAHERGVKVIGATAHYVTAVLDEGPIIEQETVRVDHSLPAAEFVRTGKDIESAVLARAIRWHAQSRVFINGHKTVVFK